MYLCDRRTLARFDEPSHIARMTTHATSYLAYFTSFWGNSPGSR
ncbi:MAG: hypothetical protein JWO39_2441 [Gemmatimonadetes bacterium]|jgi:hypothetical protein|nr:hypothetical protein [Gemmatimonadota bacterium]